MFRRRKFASMKLQSAIIIISLLAGQGARAAMTLNDCLVYARDHAHSNILGRLDVEKAAAEKRMALSGLLPDVSFSSNGNISFGRNIDPETNTYDNRQTLSTGFGIGMTLPVFDGLVNVNNLKAARVAQLRREHAASAERDLVSLEVIRSFYNVSYCKAMVEQMRHQLERDSTDLAATERGERLGMRSGADVAELQALVAADEYELANQRGLLARAYLGLRSAMGMNPTDEPLDLMEEEAAEGDRGHYGEHPRIAAARLELRESEYALRAARGAFSPRISLNAGISTSYYRMMHSGMPMPKFSHQWHDNMGEYVGFTVSIPLFTGLSLSGKLKRAKIEVRESRVKLSQTEYEIGKATAEAALDYATADAEMTAASRRLEAEKIAYEAVRRKFELGGASPVELYTSGTKLATARANYEGKRIAKIISRITLDYYHGEKLIKE